jgi:uncharacterized membrane protein (DUF4010 family)
VQLRNPFSLTSAAKFAAIFALVLLVVKLAQIHAPDRGIYFVAALAGTTDVDAITLSMAQYARTGDVAGATDAIIIAALTNTVVKGGMVAVLGSAALRRAVLASAVAIVAAGVAAIWLT